MGGKSKCINLGRAMVSVRIIGFVICGICIWRCIPKATINNKCVNIIMMEAHTNKGADHIVLLLTVHVIMFLFFFFLAGGSCRGDLTLSESRACTVMYVSICHI